MHQETNSLGCHEDLIIGNGRSKPSVIKRILSAEEVIPSDISIQNKNKRNIKNKYKKVQ